MSANSSGKPRKAASRADGTSARSRARAFALQGLYQCLVGHSEVDAVDTFTRELAGFSKCDAEHYAQLLHGCTLHRTGLDMQVQPLLDRPLAELSPIEHAVLWIGLFELQHCPDVPWRVVLNECIELAKDFGGTDGHKFINGVLHRAAPGLRPEEVRSTRPAPTAA